VFDSDKWKEQEANGNRKSMAEHLIEENTLIGKTNDEVLSLLGSPFNHQKENIWYYDLDANEISEGWIMSVEFKHDLVQKVAIWFKDL
jgi:hypothetical protein